jgi:FAD-dependent urate hydroxylase
MKAIIIGGGIGGLSAAIALDRVGIETAVFEQADQLREIGAGLTVWINASRALGKMKAAEGLLRCGSPVTRFEVRSWRGKVLAVSPFAILERKFGAAVYVCVHRGEFLELLKGMTDTGKIHCGSRCIGFDEDSSGITARFANGAEESGDIVVGADGLHSVIRARLHSEPKARYAGYTCWRGFATSTGDYPRTWELNSGDRGNGFQHIPAAKGGYSGLEQKTRRKEWLTRRAAANPKCWNAIGTGFLRYRN